MLLSIITHCLNEMLPRHKLWQFARDIYKEKILDKSFIGNLDKFSWDGSNRWLINAMAKDIQEQKTITALQHFLGKEDSDSTVAWCDEFLCFIEEYDSEILDEYELMPSQNDDLKKRGELQRDGGPIPEELKEVARLLKLGE